RATQSRRFAADALASLRSLGLSKEQRQQAQAQLVQFAERPEESRELRLAALETLGDQVGLLSPALFDFLLGNLTEETAPLERDTAAQVLAQAAMNEEQRLKIADHMQHMAALEWNRLLPSFVGAAEPVERQVLTALAAHADPSGIRRDVLEVFVAKLPPGLAAEGAAVIARVDASAAQRRERLEQLLASLPAGDIQRGHAIFNSKRAACTGCHAVAYVGGRVGPDLTLIGKIRTERDLLEAIVYPSASFVRSYEPVTVVTSDGRQFNGLVQEQTPGEILLTTGPQASQRIARDEIEVMRPSQTSLMPEGLDKLLGVQELSDLVAYLKSRQ
ncbi:MAG TPA: hypothetical protein VMF30_18475, partial [Pirellulales bacterium]|nr:hypothetical protein [Pirellulales bacterium]